MNQKVALVEKKANDHTFYLSISTLQNKRPSNKDCNCAETYEWTLGLQFRKWWRLSTRAGSHLGSVQISPKAKKSEAAKMLARLLSK